VFLRNFYLKEMSMALEAEASAVRGDKDPKRSVISKPPYMKPNA
jgi:hypothetical protein